VSIEDRPRQLERKASLQDFVDLPLRRRNALGQHGFDGQRAERHTDPAIPDVIIDRFRNFEAAAAHVADRPNGAEESRNDAEGREPRFLGPAEKTHLQARFRLDCLSQLQPVRSTTHGLRRNRVDSADAHGFGDGAKSPYSLNRSTKVVGRDFSALCQAFCKSGERLFIEARHRRAAESVIDHKPDRIRADVDDRVRASVGTLGALGVELERPQRLLRCVNGSLRHHGFSGCVLITAKSGRPVDGLGAQPA
jgi:hypothetical protein